MAKSIIYEKDREGVFNRGIARHHYRNYYYNIFMNKYKLAGDGVERRHSEWVLKKLWATGSVASFIVKGTKSEDDLIPTNVDQYPSGMIAFTTFAPFSFDIYDYPIDVNLVQTRGAKFIPTDPQVVNKDVVIIWAQRNHKPISEYVDFIIEKVVDVDMVIRTQLKTLKMPWAITTTPENESTLKSLFRKLDNDDDALFLSGAEKDSFNIITGSQQYIIDKLWQYRLSLLGELDTFFGVNNMGGMEKKEHLVVDEININNQKIQASGDCIADVIREGCEDVKKYLGFNLTLEVNEVEPDMDYNEDEEKTDEDKEVKDNE